MENAHEHANNNKKITPDLFLILIYVCALPQVLGINRWFARNIDEPATVVSNDFHLTDPTDDTDLTDLTDL